MGFWYRNVLAGLIASGIFAALFILGSSLPLLIVASSIIFLPVGIWLGRDSPAPWRDGAIYGGLSFLMVTLVLFASGSPMGARNFFYALILALPQGLVGTYLGARVPWLRALGRRETQGLDEACLLDSDEP